MCWNIQTAGVETSPWLCAVVSLKECRHTIPQCKLLSDERRCNLLLTLSRAIWMLDLPVSPHEMMTDKQLQSHCEVEDLRSTNLLYDNTQNCFMMRSLLQRWTKLCTASAQQDPEIMFKMFLFQVYMLDYISPIQSPYRSLCRCIDEDDENIL